jgi:CxxC motif-containing protein (DUF1111 family)
MTRTKLLVAVVCALIMTAAGAAAQLGARDPGVRGSTVGGADPIPLPGLTPSQLAFFNAGLAEFRAAETVGDGLGPRFNLDSCAGCHNQPATGGSSPGTNPQASMVNRYNVLPSFITSDGPVREVRYKRNPDGSPDGGVHALFVISGRTDTDDHCTITQPNFDRQYANGNVIFRIPTPVFGAGLIEQIPDAAIVANRAANAGTKAALGIAGRPNRFRLSGEPNNNPNDGTIARFGWKAQNKSLLLFSGEAYNVEMGITNELFPTERDETPGCQYTPTPNDITNTDATDGMAATSAVEKFATFMRFLAPPQPSPDTPGGATSIGRGRLIFAGVGCAYCHTPTLQTGYSTVAALNKQPVNLYSDLMVHNMGPGLADDIAQGAAGGDEFRTAPLWGLGQRIFFLHDGRTTDLMAAIRAHKSAGNTQYRGSEASVVVDRLNALPDAAKQDLLNFLRSL